MAKCADLPKVAHDDIMQAIQALSKNVAAQQKVWRRPRFPHLCRNGASCQWLACGACWFKHAEVDAVKQDDGKQGTDNRSKIGVPSELKAKETQIANLEAKFKDLSNYMDRRLHDLEGKLEALAEGIFNNESQIGELAANPVLAKFHAPKLIEDLPFEGIERIIDGKLHELEAKVHSKVDGGFDEIRTLIHATIEMFSTKVRKRFMDIEDLVYKLQGFDDDQRSELHVPSEPVATGG